MRYTENYNFKKPDGTDVVNIEDFNENADIIDAELKKLNDAIKDLDADGITLPDGKTISEKFEEITEEVGNIQELNTDEKANIVAAINEIYQALLTHKQNTNQEIGQVASDLAAHKAEMATKLGRTTFHCTALTGYKITASNCFVVNNMAYINLQIQKNDETAFDTIRHTVAQVPYSIFGTYAYLLATGLDGGGNSKAMQLPVTVGAWDRNIVVRPTETGAIRIVISGSFTIPI